MGVVNLIEMTEQQIKETTEILAKDKRALISVKNALVKAKCYELAAELRKIEHEKFPETEEQKAAKEEAEKFNLLFRMVELDIEPMTAYLIVQTVKKFGRRKGNFDIKDAVKLANETKRMFGAV